MVYRNSEVRLRCLFFRWCVVVEDEDDSLHMRETKEHLIQGIWKSHQNTQKATTKTRQKEVERERFQTTMLLRHEINSEKKSKNKNKQQFPQNNNATTTRARLR